MLARKIAKSLIPMGAREWMREQRVAPVLQWLYRKELSQFIESSNLLTEEKVQEVMQRHGYNNRWAAVYTILSDIPSKDYVPEDFFHLKILPRMNNMRLLKAYEDKNMYDLTPLSKFTVPVIVRKIDGRYFDGNYNPVTTDDIKSAITQAGGDIVVKPAIESGSGKDVWIGAADDAFDEFMGRTECLDIIVQKRLRGDDFSAAINPASFNTVRCMTAFTGTEHVVLASVLRVGRMTSWIDNLNAGGMSLGLGENGELPEFGYDKYLNRYAAHPDSGFLFKGKVLPGYAEIKAACLEAHKNLPHFGLISWDVAKDSTGAVKIVELNIDWQGINFFQSTLGPLMGRYKEQIRKTYGIPDWGN